MKSPLAVLRVLRRSQDHDGRGNLTLKMLQDLEPVDLGEVQVKKNEVRFEGGVVENIDRVLPIVSDHNVGRDGALS